MVNKEIPAIQSGDITINPEQSVYIAGPCAVESEAQIFSIAQGVVGLGADMLRGGAYKPRTSPDSFQGLGEQGLHYLFEAGKTYNIPVVTEVMDISQINTIKRVAKGHPFIYQVGSRNAQNYSLLKDVGETGVPVLLKRGMGATTAEMVGSAEYITRGGSPVLMCERGIVSFSDVGRYTVDHLAILKFQEKGFLTIFDPSHAAGDNKYVISLGLSGIAIGANGLIVEVHNNPESALCDKDQAISFSQFQELIQKAKMIERVVMKG